MLSDHIAAIKSLLIAAGFIDVLDGGIPPGIALYDGQVPAEPTLPYVAMWSTGGTRPSSSLAVEMDHFDVPIYLTHVGVTAEAVRTVQDQSRGALLAVRPTVVARDCSKLELSYCEPIREDRDIRLSSSGRHPMYGVDVWRLASVPA